MNKYYKETFSAFHPSDEAVERVFEMTTDKKKAKLNPVLKRIGAAVLVFVLIVGGGFGINSAVSKRNVTSDGLRVMIAMAGEKELFEAGEVNEEDVFCGIYVADLEDEEEMKAVRARWAEDNAKLEKEKEKEIGSFTRVSTYSQCYSKKLDKITAAVHTTTSGAFFLNMFDYSNIKNITIENASIYGELFVEYWNVNRDLSEISVDDYYETFGQDSIGYFDTMQYIFSETEDKIVLSKENLQAGAESETDELLLGDAVSKPGYILSWNPSEFLLAAIGDDVDFDLSQIKDTITFTVNYEDGTSEQASVSLQFDKDGYMHIVNAD